MEDQLKLKHLMGYCLLLPHRPDRLCCSSFVHWLLVLPPVNKPFWFAVDCVQQHISTFGGAVLELFPTMTFIFLIPAKHWVDSFISRPFSSASHGAVATLNLRPLCLWALSASRWATSLGLTAWQAGFQSSPWSLVHLTPDHFPLSHLWLASIAEEDREGARDYEMICNPCRTQERSNLTADGKSCWIFQEKTKKLTHNKLEFSFSNLKAASTTQSDVSFNITTYCCCFCPCIIQKSHKRKKYSSEFLWLPYW